MAQDLIPKQNPQQPTPIRLVGGPQTGVADEFRQENVTGEFAKGWHAVAAAEASAAAAEEANAARARKDYAGEAAHLRSMQELQAAAQANAPRVSSLGQISGFGDAVDYGKQLAGSVIPGAINPILGGTAGGLLGAALGAKFKLGAGTRALFGTGGALGAMYPSMTDTAIQQHVVAGDQQSPEDILTQSRIQALKQLAPFAFGGGAVQQLGNRVAGNVAQGVRQAGLGTSFAKSAFEQGVFGAASAKIGQLEQDRWNQGRDKSGDTMEMLDNFAGEALAGAMFEGPGYAAQALHQTRRDAQSAIGALAQEGVRVAPGLIDKGVAKVKNSLGIAGEAINTGVDKAAAAADTAWANAPKSVAEAAGMASGRSRNAIDEFLRDKSGDFAKQPAFADLFTPLRGDVDAKDILAQTAAKNKSAEAFANYTVEMGEDAPPYVKAAAEEYLAGPKNYDTWHTSGLADAANVWEQSRKRNDQLASIYSVLSGAGGKALAEFQNGRDEARSEGPYTSTQKGTEKRYDEIFNTLTGVSDPANQHVDAKWILDVEQAVGRYKADKTIAGDDEKIAWFRTHPYVFDELPANKNLAGMAKTLYDNHGPLSREEIVKSVDSFGDLQRSMDKLKHLRKTQNPDIQLSLGDTFVPKAVQGNQQRPQMSLGDTPRDTTTQPNPLETTAPLGLRDNAVPEEAMLSHRLLQLEQHNNDIFRQAYARAKKVSPQAVATLLQKFGLKAPPVKGELPDGQILDTYTDSAGREVRHQTNLGVNRAPMSEKDWVAISLSTPTKLRQSEVGGRGAITSHTGEGRNLANLLYSKSANAKDAAYEASTIPSDKNVLEFLSNNGLAGVSPEANANNDYNQRLYAQQRETFGSPGEKAKTREIEAAIGRTEAANQRAYQQQKAVVENMRAKLKDNNALFDDPMLTEEQLRTHPTLREAEYKLEDLAKQLAVKEVKPLSDARFGELMGKFPELTEAETVELTAHAPYLIDSLRLKKKLTPRDEAQLSVANELITHAAREKQRFDRLKPQATNGVKYKRFEQAWADIPDATRDDPFNKALTTSLAPFYPHQHIGAQQHDLPAHALGLRLWVGNGLDTKRPRKGDNGKLYVNPKGELQGLDKMASVWGSASKARDALQKTYDMMVHEGLIPNDIRPAVAERIKRAKLILSQQHYANRELGNLVLQNLKPSALAQLGGGLEAAKSFANQIIRAVNEQGDPDKVFDSAVLKSQFEKFFGERAEQTRQAFWLAYKGREQRATDEVIKQSGDGVGEGESGRVESVVGEDLDGNTTMRDMDNAFGKEGDVRTSDDAAWVRGDDTAEFNNTDGDGDVVDSDLAAMTNAMAPTTVAPPKAKFHHQTAEKKVKYDQMNGGTNRRRFHDVYDPGQKKRVSAILESPGMDEARLNSLKEQDDLNNMAVPYIKGYEHTFEKSGSTFRHEETLAKAIADIKARGVSDAKAVGYIDYLKEQFGVPDIYDVENPPDSARRFDAAVAQIVKRFSQDSDSPETKIEIANLKKRYSDPSWVEEQRAKKVEAELVLAEISARRELTDTEKANVVARVNRQFKDFMKAGQDRQIEARRRKNEPNYDKLLTVGLNPYTKEALDEINSKLFVIKEEAKNESFNGTDGMRIDSSEFSSVSHTSSSNKWGVAPGQEGERSHAAVGGIWLRRASDGKVFMTTADKIVQRARNAMFAAGETQNVKGAKATHDLFLQGLAMLFEPEAGDHLDAMGDGYSTKAGVLPEIGIFTRPLGKLQMNNELKLSPIDALSIPDSLKIGGTTWGELRKSARERNVADDRTFLREKQKELDKTLAKLDEKMGRGEALTEIEDFEYGNALKDRDIAKNALRFEELNTKIKALKAKRDRTDVENEAYSAANAELAKLHEADKERQKALDLEGIEKRIAAQQKVVSDMRNGVVKGGKLFGEGIGAEEAEGLHALYKSHMGEGGNRATGLPELGIDVMRDHPEGIKLRELQKLYDTKYDSTPGTTASLAEAVTYLSKWKDDQQAVYDYDDDAKRISDARSDAEYKSIRPFKDETKEAAIARNERRKFNNQKSMLDLVADFHEDTIEHEGGTGVTYTFKPESMVKVLGGGWRALNERRAAKGKPPIDKVTYLQSEMDLVRALINEPEDAPLWDKYSPHFALPKTDVKKGKWKGVKEQVVSAVNALRDAREVSTMTQQALREAKANYAQVLADAKTPGSAISEVHVKAFSKNLIDARERFQAALDVLRDKKDDVKDLELEHQHLVEDYNERVKNRADEIHRLKSGLRSLVGYVDGLVNKTQKANQYPMRTEEGAPVLDKDGKQVYGVGVRGFSDTAKDVAHKIVDNKGVEATPTNALNEGYIFQRGQFFRIEDSEGNVVPFKDAKAREVSEKAVFNAVSVSETEALKAGFSYLKSAKDILDENNERSVQRSRTSGVGRRIDLAATAEDTEIYKRIAKESDRERTYQEETGAALGAYGAKEYVTSSLDKRTLDIARNLARTNPDFNPAHAKGGWTQEMVDVWNSEKNKMATEYAQTVTYKKASNWLAEKGVPAAVAMLRKQSPESQAHYLAMFDELGGGGKEVWGDTLPSEAVRGKFRAAAAALRGLEEKRGALEKQTVMWGKGADAGKVVAVLGKDGVYRNSMGHEVLVTDSNTQVGVDKSPLNVWAGSGENTVLSNLNPRKFTFEGRPYVSVEQAYQSLKSGAFEQGVYNQYTGRAVQKIPGTLGTKTEGGYNLGLIKSLMKASFEQNESAKNALLATGERTITHTQDKGVWNKEFPRILTEIRKELSENSTPVATKSVASKATLSMNYADGTDGMRMRPEFAGKSTMDLIASGDRTATTRSSIGAFKGVKNGDVFTVTNSAGTTIKVRATSDPYPVSKVTPENWSKLEGWSPAVYNKYSDGFQMTYEKVLENVAGKAAASNLDTSNITRKMLRDNPDKVFIFGDNEARKGLGGQAQQMRGEPNAIGVATKRLPSRGEDAYWSDAEFERNKQILDADFKPAFEAKAAGKEVVVPKNGIGGGLSELSSRAPRTLEYINQQLSLLRENVAEKSTPVATKAGAKGISLHSGGAIGADYEWGVAVAKHGVVANHYMAEGFPTPHGNAFVTPEQMKVGLSQARKAARNLGRHMGSNEYVNSLLARNWAQVDNSDAVYAVSDLIAPYESGKATKSGKRYVNESGQTVVDGGTGYAVQMAINEGKPVYVFHQGTSQNYSHEVGWYKYDHLRKEFTKTSQPELVDSFAGIGTREINAVGAKAINDIVSAKFSTAEPSQKKDTVATLIGQDAGVKEAMHAVKELIQNPLGDANAVEKFGNALDYIKSQLKEISAAIKLDTGNQALLNRQAQFSRAYAAVEAAALRYKENQYVRAEGYPAMSLGARGEFTKRLQAVEHSLVDSGETPERLEQVRKLLDTAQKKSKRIAPTEELTSVATSPKPLDLMLGEANAAHVFAPPSEDVVQAMRDSVERRFGDRIRAVFEEGDTVTHASISARAEQWGADGAKQKVKGLWSPTENLIKVALATQHPMQTLDHESFHAFYSGMVEGGVLTEGARQILLKAANSEYVRKRLDALFPENKVQHADTGFGKEKHSSGVTHAESERMANMFALWRAGELTLAPAPRNIFAKIWGKLKRVIGILREEDKADVILKAFDAGHLKTNEAVHAIYNALSARDRMMTELNRWTRPLAVIAQRLFYTAEVNLDKAGKTYSPEYKKIRRLFKRAVGEGGENGYLDAKDQMLKKFSNLVAAPFRALEPEDMPRLAKALAGGYENPTTAIGKAREALIGENGLIRQIDKYMADAGVQYLTGVDEKTGQQIWKTVEPMPAGSMPKSFRVNDVMSKGDEFIADLWEHNHKEMTEMFNSTRAKFDLAVDQVKTPDQELVDFNRAVLQRVINTFGQLHIPELTTDIGMSPIMQALNSRSISWVNPKVYEKWGENDVMKTFTSYASQAVKLTESVRRFGNGNVELHAMLQKGEWDGLRKEIQHSFHVDIGETPPKKEAGKKKLSMFDAAKQSIYEEKSLNAGEKAHLEKIFKRIKDVAKKAGTDVAGMQGLLGYDINPTLRKFQNSMLVYQNMRSLATSLLSQFIDPLNLVVRGATMGEAWDAYKRGLREVVASIKGEEIRDLDLTIAEHVGTVDAHGFLGAYGQLYSSEYMGNWFRKANDFLFRYNGMEGFNRGMQVAATRSAINFIKRHTEKPGKNSSSYLAEIGLRAEKVKIDERGELDYNDPRIQRAIYQWVSGAVMRPNASQRPAYASDPHYMVFWHMKQFAYTFHDSIMKRAIHDYNKYGDTGPLGVMATCFAPVMIAADVAKSVLLTGDAPGWWNAGLPDIIEHGVNRAGLSGQYQPIVDIATTPGRSWLGLGGPMIEQLQQLGDQTMGQAAVSALPGQNVIKQVFGVGGGGVEMLNTSED